MRTNLIMLSEAIIDRIKQTAVTIAIGAIIAVIPFYFQTKAQTEANGQNISELQKLLQSEVQRIEQIEVSQAIGNTEIAQMKTSLERIERKIDRLIERAE